MIKIYDGREAFYQWDINQRVIVEDANIVEVHFSNRDTEPALICEVYEENGLRLANVPNILLQECLYIKVYGACKLCVRQYAVFGVKKRSKPTDYVYTETEIKNYDALEERIKFLEDNGGISVDLSKYATKEELETAIEAIPQPDLSPYAKKDEVPSIAGLATEAYVNNAIDAIPEPDMSKYALKTDVPSVAGLATESYVNSAIGAIEFPKTDLSDYYTKKETETVISNNKQDLTPYALKTDIPTLTGYATETFVSDAIKAIPKTDLSGYYTKTETDSAITAAKQDLSPYALKTDIPSLNGYATETYVNTAIGKIDFPETDLSNYYTKAETNTAINNAKPDLSPYALKKDIPTLNGYATETFVNSAIAAIPKTDLSGYYTKSEIDSKGYLTAHQDLSAYALKTDIPNVSSFITMAAVEAKGYQTATQVNNLINTALGVIENGTY